MHRSAPSPRELLAVALGVARDAAATAYRMRVEGVSVAATKSTVTDVVTAADRAVERQVLDALRELRPDDAVLGEEYGTRDTGPVAPDGVRWIVDPIDGTVNYLYGLAHSAVSLAAEVDGVVVAGVVRNVHTGEEWTATVGGGAWRDGVRLRCSGEVDLGQALVGTGFGYDAARRAHQGQVVAGLIAHVRDIRRLGAAALDLCLVAEGRLDAYFEKGLAAWDLAAGGLVAAEAGVRVGGLAGAPPGPDLVVAAPPALFGPLHDRLAKLDAAGGP
ncbi:inositol monophosphatase family protein [Micromonospora sp. WMMC250]|uniref:inositol monophosphatase family protein n=1 Tax=Micromonospora sp. WMMC250 TaxID=3014781 RepID=UPI0022B635B0|nr:inositol monophosphatase family protein [Micromonospora sp. WMMC250]MCZ7376110.1 inositol monophosphatase family protein [Micromonospora sp. WMMC250]